MNSRHTTGPWTCHVGGGRWSIRAQRPLNAQYGGWRYCSISDRIGGPEGEREANAHLIAAAPDMLEMLRISGVNLETAASTLERLGDKPNADAFRRMAEQILPVIAKAEGAAV